MSTLHRVFDPRANALNAVRLILAVGVVVWHSFPLTGTANPARPLVQLLGSGFVDGFFAISGFLILSSWTRNPHWWPYLKARVLRIMPGFYVCLIVTAAIFAPLSTVLSTAQDHVVRSSAASFIYRNGLLRINQYDISGTLQNVPYHGIWNGSLWTLWWEFLCYLGVLLLGITRLLRFRVVLPIAFLVSLIALITVTYHPMGNYYLDNAPRFMVMFLAGSLVYAFQRQIIASWRWVLLAGLIVAGSLWLPDYRMVAALPLAYLTITTGALIKTPRLTLRNDLSYGMYVYAFPVQQLVATVGGNRLGVAPFFVVSTLLTIPVAAASWFFVEKPMLKLKSRRQTAPIVRSLPADSTKELDRVGRAAHRR